MFKVTQPENQLRLLPFKTITSKMLIPRTLNGREAFSVLPGNVIVLLLCANRVDGFLLRETFFCFFSNSYVLPFQPKCVKAAYSMRNKAVKSIKQ